MPIWNVRSMSEEPEVELVRWRIFETETGERHFVGIRPATGSGRVSSCIVQLDTNARVGLTVSGRQYHLPRDSGHDSLADCIWCSWVRTNVVAAFRDVTDELLTWA
jgi:hypothetical protein